MQLSDFRPRSALVAKTTRVDRPRYPAVDAHNHIGFSGWDQRPVSELLDALDEAGVRVLVDLDGGWGEDILARHIDAFKAAAPDRFCMFGGVDWAAWPERGNAFGDWAAGRLRAQAARGAQGFKVWKNLGLRVRDQAGALAPIDDERLDPIWAAAGELGLPVMFHIADPVAFFWPLDERNERWEELQAHPDWHFPSPPYPSFESLVEGMARVVERHPGTTFIGAHGGCYAENLAWVSRLLERCPNFYIDISARIGELGRQPYTARRFFLRHAGRILFGTDATPAIDMYRLHYRFLESDDESFDYGLGEVPAQGRWQVCGLRLPDRVLRQVYYENAERVILGG